MPGGPLSAVSGQPNVNDYDNDPVLVSELQLADGRKFIFKYNSYAELAEVQLHTGGFVRYEWAGYTAAGDGMYGDLLIYRRLKTRKIYDLDGTTLLSQTEYVCPNLEQQSSVQVTVTAIEKDAVDAVLRTTEHSFHGGPISAATLSPLAFPGWREGREYDSKVKEQTGAVLQEVQQVWQQRGPANTSITPSSEMTPPNDPRITQTTTTLGGLSAVRTFAYSVDEHNNVSQQCDRDFGAGTATRCTDWTYVTSAAYTATPVHLRGLPLSQTVTRYVPGPTTVESSTSYEYDAGGLTSYAVVAQHDDARGSGFATRGNVTKQSRTWAESPDGSAAETTASYDIAGNRVSVTTPKVETEAGRVAGTTTISYADQFDYGVSGEEHVRVSDVDHECGEPGGAAVV